MRRRLTVSHNVLRSQHPNRNVFSSCLNCFEPDHCFRGFCTVDEFTACANCWSLILQKNSFITLTLLTGLQKGHPDRNRKVPVHCPAVSRVISVNMNTRPIINATG